MKTVGVLAVLAALGTTVIAAQDHPLVIQAQTAFADLDYETAITVGQQSLGARLSREDRIAIYELLGFAYGALDSARQAVDAFKELIFLAPDREPDPIRVSPRITSLYGSALGQVLVVRRVAVDSTSFIAGEGDASFRFEITRPGRVTARIVGNGLDQVIDSTALGAGTGRLGWRTLSADGQPVPPGTYQLVLKASAGRDEFATQHPIVVTHGTIDTLAHLTSVPGYTLQEESVQPARNWRPLGVATLYTLLASGASLALENTGLGSPERKEIGGVSFAVLLTGFIMSLKKPDREPVESSILYNQLLREELERRNFDLATRNGRRRQQVLVTVQSKGSS